MRPTTKSMEPYDTCSASSDGKMSAGLVLLFSPAYQRLQPAYPLKSEKIRIGRDATCAIVFPEQAVSRQHAELEYHNNAWYLRDLGSANGTIVDGISVDEIELADLHEIRVGDNILKFVAKDAQNYVGYGIDGLMVGNAKRLSSGLIELVGGLSIDRIGEQIELVAPTPLSVLILGESGTGKEVVARELHRLSGRSGPLHAINCAAIPPNLIESELFGYKRGAFTGAMRDKPGIIASADNGTVLLDEIGDMPMDAQPKLLRVIQTGEVLPIGATQARNVNVRFICATNLDLSTRVNENRFRGDLYARINLFRLTLPPLRERKEDIYQLSRALLDRNNHTDIHLSFQAMLALLHYDWPYNVRELEGVLLTAALLAKGSVIEPRHLDEKVQAVMERYGAKRPPSASSATRIGVQPDSEPAPVPRNRQRHRASTPTKEDLCQLLSNHQGNVAAVAGELGKERNQIYRWMRHHNIVVDDFRK